MTRNAARQSATRPDSPQSRPGRVRSESPPGYVVAKGESQRRGVESDRRGESAGASQPVTVLVTADISGKKTNRVRVPARSPLTRSVTPPDPSPQRAVRRYKADRIAERGPGTVIAVSIPAQDLCAMDELAERLRMSRSHLIREAVRVFAANSNEPEEP